MSFILAVVLAAASPAAMATPDRPAFVAMDDSQTAEQTVYARAEQDPQLKREAVQKLSLMRSKEATDYMMELLK